MAGALLLLFAIYFQWKGWHAPAIAFAIAGAVALAFRVVCRVEPRRTLIRMCWTILGVPFLSIRRIPIDSIRSVDVELSYPNLASKEEHRPRRWYSVRLHGARNLTVHASGDLLAARRFAKRVARALALPLHDHSTGRFRAYEVEELGMNLGQRLHHRGQSPALPAPPAGSRIWLRDGAQQRVELPPQGLPTLAYLLGLAVPAILIAWIWRRAPHDVAPLLLLPVACVVVFLAWKTMAAARPKVVAIGPDGVELQSFGSRKRIDFVKLEDIVHIRGDLHLLSDKARLVIPYIFGTSSEAQFVIGLIEYAAYQHEASHVGAFATERR